MCAIPTPFIMSNLRRACINHQIHLERYSFTKTLKPSLTIRSSELDTPTTDNLQSWNNHKIKKPHKLHHAALFFKR
jgi:hypothetical protein